MGLVIESAGLSLLIEYHIPVGRDEFTDCIPA